MNLDLISVSSVDEPFDATLMAVATRTTGGIERIDLEEVRGAAVPPTEGQPGYCLWLARTKRTDDRGAKPLLMLSESSEHSQEELITRILDEVIRLRVSILYAEQPDQGLPAGFWGELVRAMRTRKQVKLKAAASVKDLSYGINLAVDAHKDKRLVLLEGNHALRSQMRTIAQTVEPGVEYYAFHALRFILAGFRRDRRPAEQRQMMSGQNARRQNPGGWT